MSETYREEQEANIGEALMDQEELYDAIEHEPKMIEHIDKDGNVTIRPMTAEEEANFEHDFECELENDMEDYE